MKADWEVVVAALKHHGGCDILHMVSPPLQNDKAIVLLAIRERAKGSWAPGYYNTTINGQGILQHTSPELRDDPEVVGTALKDYHGYEIIFASNRLQNDPAFLGAASFSNLRHDPDRVGAIQHMVQDEGNCLEIKARMRKLHSLLFGRQFPPKRLSPRKLQPAGFSKKLRTDNICHRWCIKQISLSQGLPDEVGSRVLLYSGITEDDPFVAQEIQELGPFLVAASDKFYPRYTSWWVFVAGKCTQCGSPIALSYPRSPPPQASF